jgi:hypothetical protein
MVTHLSYDHWKAQILPLSAQNLGRKNVTKCRKYRQKATKWGKKRQEKIHEDIKIPQPIKAAGFVVLAL